MKNIIKVTEDFRKELGNSLSTNGLYMCVILSMILVHSLMNKAIDKGYDTTVNVNCENKSVTLNISNHQQIS